ncbi:hypothetical protein ABZ313_02690 [Streptomyces sp. NPDC006251]|uniref:hypothetical protein n=1 Tax=Streptomyces sp. NPDC006251 TaxID=3155718 RepID=UPI0033AB702E
MPTALMVRVEQPGQLVDGSVGAGEVAARAAVIRLPVLCRSLPVLAEDHCPTVGAELL